MLIHRVSHEIILHIMLSLCKALAHMLCCLWVAEEKVVLLVIWIIYRLRHVLKHAIFIVVIDWVHRSKLGPYLRLGSSWERLELIREYVVWTYLLLVLIWIIFLMLRLFIDIWLILHEICILRQIFIFILFIINIFAIFELINRLNIYLQSVSLFIL